MPIRKTVEGLPTEYLPARGLFNRDPDALTPVQQKCISRVCMSLQLEDEAYLTQHPELLALLEVFMSKQCKKQKYHTNFLKEAAEFFVRPEDELDKDARERLGIGSNEPYVSSKKPSYHMNDENSLLMDLFKFALPTSPIWSARETTKASTETFSSSFLSIDTSDTTLPTPEPEPPKLVTDSEHFFKVISNCIDKAIFSKVDDKAILYDIAYVRVTEAVEEAMEIPVTEIKEDVIELFFNAYTIFEAHIVEQERLAAERAWNRRMRKKMKRTLRRKANFKGYETPPSVNSSMVSSHSSDHIPPLAPCKCHPQFHYNRYAKDRFGIYLPTKEQYSHGNTTVTPVITPSTSEEEAVGENDSGSKMSVATTVSKTSKASKVSKASKASKKAPPN